MVYTDNRGPGQPREWLMKELSEITLHFHLSVLLIPDSEPEAHSKMVPLKKRFELLLCLSQRSAGYLPVGNQD